MAEANARSVTQLAGSLRALEGGGFPVRRPFPTSELAMLDPFVLLDHMGPVEWPPGEALGAPDHPHRGFETVTYLLEGRMQHRDSSGHSGALGPGDVQWMTAGAGVVHSELPEEGFRRQGGRMNGFQLWVNLPARDKMIAPRYQEIPASAIPVAEGDRGKVRVRVIAGESLGARAVIETRTPIALVHATVQPGGRFVQPLPRGFNAGVFVISGGVEVGAGATHATEAQLAVLGDGEGVPLAVPRDAPEPADLLILAGQPLREPVARYGPFVMNTRDEIEQAFLDYQAGRMGQIAPGARPEPARGSRTTAVRAGARRAW